MLDSVLGVKASAVSPKQCVCVHVRAQVLSGTMKLSQA